MTLADAIRAAAPASIGEPYKAIRRAAWCAGHRIQWVPERTLWVFSNRFEVGPIPVISRRWNRALEPSQGLLTPETILADDWEIASTGADLVRHTGAAP